MINTDTVKPVSCDGKYFVFWFSCSDATFELIDSEYIDSAQDFNIIIEGFHKAHNDAAKLWWRSLRDVLANEKYHFGSYEDEVIWIYESSDGEGEIVVFIADYD